MKLWMDDVRPAPDDYIWVKTVNEAKRWIMTLERMSSVELIDTDHDAGDYAWDGGDYIKLLDWLEETGRNYPIHIHSMNPVGRQNMLAICQKNNWKVVY